MPDPIISWPDDLDDAPWPSPYRAFSDECLASEPRLPRRIIMQLAPLVTSWILEDDQSFARQYGFVAALFQNQVTTRDLSQDYREILRARLRKPRVGDANSTLLDNTNEHDIANVHRAVWLIVYRALTCLIDIDLHGDWGDPPAGGTSQGREGYEYPPHKSFHTTPNGYGSFAISTLDIPPADLGIGEASSVATNAPAPGAPLPLGDVKKIARALGRGLTDPDNGDKYLYVVKSFYRDRLNHTSVPGDIARSYADVIKSILDQSKSGVAMPPALYDDDFANIHRGAWLFLAHRFYFLVGKPAFGELMDVSVPTSSVALPLQKDGNPDPRVFEVPNLHGMFTANLRDIDPDGS